MVPGQDQRSTHSILRYGSCSSVGTDGMLSTIDVEVPGEQGFSSATSSLSLMLASNSVSLAACLLLSP